MSDFESASAMIAAAGIDAARLATSLPRVDPAMVKVWVAPRWFRRFWAKGIAAVALPTGIYVQPELMARYRSGKEPGGIGRLIVHELTHIEQWRRLGALRHITQYSRDYLGGRLGGKGHWDSYRAIRLEVEARDVANRVMEGA